ncbi:MAG: hypothetical protein HFJ50_03315 [Clostridia bacterium]|jgi:hypothetical protein|nr:hypothetical protein [Clostridia bacterium]
MKKISKFTLPGIIIILAVLLAIQWVVILDKQIEIETANSESHASKKIYDDLKKHYDKLNEDYNALQKKHSDLQETKATELDSKNNEQPSSYDKSAFADKVLSMYLNGEWDGYATTIHSHEVSLDYAGSIKIDAKTWVPSDFCYEHSIDLPADMGPVNTNIFILGDGTYQLVNNRITKYSKGKSITLSGGTLDWSGMDTENYRPFDTEFCYDEANDILYLIASSVPYDFSSKELKDNVGIYLYSIPDRSKSEIKFISQIKYTEINNDYIFDESTDPIIKDFLDMERMYEFEFDWWCSFADGFISTREAFPEGTFTHPVTTTPYVSLSQYKG